MSRVILEDIIADFSLDKFTRFFREKSNKFAPKQENISQYNDENFKDGKKLGEIKFAEAEQLAVFAFQASQSLSERSGKKAQYDKGKGILKDRQYDAGIFIFYDAQGNFRFSLIYANYLGKRRDWSVFRRFTYFVSKDFTNKTFLQRIGEGDFSSLDKIKDAFSVEKVTKEFYLEYRKLFESLLNVLFKNQTFLNEVEKSELDIENFAKKLLGQIVFLYFIQKKGWLGVPEGGKWGEGDKNFLSNLFKQAKNSKKNFFNDYLEKLFYNALNNPRRDSADPSYSKDFNCRIPFLNGGLFEAEYNWKDSLIYLDDEIFQTIFEIFDRYNFTVEEESPDDKEIAIDPEMLGKVFENLLAENLRKGKGTYYTPREIVYYMCQESLINYLDSNSKIGQKKAEKYVKFLREDENKSIAAFEGEAVELDELLKNIKVCDPACGSGAFLVGMLNEIVRLRLLLRTLHPESIAKRTEYELKKETIQNCIYGVDIDPGAIEIAKLRLWLQLVVDYELKDIEPLPNLDYRLMCGNSLLEEFEGVKFYNGEQTEQQATLLIDTKKQKKIAELKKKIKEYFDIHDDKEKQAKRKEINDIKDWLVRSALEKRKQDFSQERKKAEYEIANLKTEKDRKKHLEKWAGVFLSEGKIEKVLNDLHNPKKEKPFFIWKLEFIDVFEDKGGFDVVIANPPYIGEKGHKEMFREIRKGSLIKFYQRKMDLFYFFFHLALNLGKQDSNVAFITTNYYPTATGGKKLREDFKNRAIISRLINLNELKIFESALGQHNMITILQKRNGENAIAKTCITKRKGDAKPEILKAIVDWKDAETDYFQIAQKNLYDGDECYIRLMGNSETTGSPVQVILEKIKSQCERLDSICNVSQGLLTGIDKITQKHKNNNLIKDLTQINHGVFALSQKEISEMNLTKEESKIIFPFFKNSDIRKYYSSQVPRNYVIYATRDLNIEDYPNINKHFKEYKKAIISRSQDRGEMQAALKLGKWWVIFAARNKDVFLGEKIVVPQRSYENIFAYNSIGWFASADVYFITRKNNDIELKYILALLNSNLYFHWLYYRGKRKGEMLELLFAPLSEIPIKKISSNEQKPFIEIVDKILAITKSSDYLENPNKQAKVKEYEKQIDQMVYKLYNLTDKEINIVENKNS